jgi:hypothetical protein
MQSFRRYIIEVAQQGFQYERNAVEALKPFDIVPKSFVPAGAGSDIPDLMIKRPGPGQTATGCELKITAASAGSLVMKWNDGNWSIGSENETNDEKLFVIELAKQVGILDTIKSSWKQEPYKFTKNRNVLSEIEGLNKRAIYSKELSRFSEIKGVIPATKIEEYYNKKKTYYVNVGTDGFFLLGNNNPLGLKGVPSFGNAATAGYRARVQAKGGGTYQFTFEMSFSIPRARRSPFNIAPTMGKTVNIDFDVMEKTLKDLFGV